MDDAVQAAFELRFDIEGFDMARMPSGAYASKRTADALMVWRASRKAALEQVRAELDRRFELAWNEYKVQFLGAHSEGQADALADAEEWVERLLSPGA